MVRPVSRGTEPAARSDQHAPLLIITGMSGAGRTTSISALEDLGYETLNSFPIGLLGPLIHSMRDSALPLAVGIGTGSRGFSATRLIEAADLLRDRWRSATALVFLDCADDAITARYSATRRRHPLAAAEDVATGIARERDILAPLRDRADHLIDTTTLSPHGLRDALAGQYALDHSPGLSVTIQSFSYKRGAPAQADMVMDCRFLRNPYWDEKLRPLDGRNPAVQGFVRGDSRYDDFMTRLEEMVLMLLPAYAAEGKAHFCLGLGCTGGRHRSVTVATKLAETLAEAGWRVALRHRELSGTEAEHEF